ncbi:uncharacterized protein LOC135106437 isoform X3 [Scylla paramamosain]|uniref:uncharacterized protein LOC135106437 isoform X3 n=1 Tax=Scylla paramamosain TaxID=85552 RepID=UPI00308327B3
MRKLMRGERERNQESVVSLPCILPLTDNREGRFETRLKKREERKKGREEWWIDEEWLTQLMSHDGQRCNLTVYVLYKTSSNLHIMSHASHQEESSLFATGKEARETKLQETLLISRVILMGVTLPLKWPESGPVMLSVVLKDAVVWHGMTPVSNAYVGLAVGPCRLVRGVYFPPTAGEGGCAVCTHLCSLAADKYSFIEVQEKGKAMIDNAVLNQALSPLSDVTQEDSLTLVSGTIIKVEEENAFIHFICGNCKSDKIQEAGDGHIDCISCGHKSVLHSQGYFLEVWLDCGPDLQQTYVKVKLYQKTIKKLLLACCGPQEEVRKHCSCQTTPSY